MNIELPVFVETALTRLAQNGYEAYIVGGSVRDSLLGVIAGDWDICTNARPEEILDCFKDFRVVETGIKHGTVTVFIDRAPVEITTFRIEGRYSDNRHPDRVEFVESLKADLSRRDFTINAMAFSPQSGLIDYFGGREDLLAGIIRCVGDARRRFCEDALRMLRALRFASVFNFSIAGETSAAIFSEKELLKNISAERVSAELNLLLCGAGAGTVLREYSDIFYVIIPQLKILREKGIWEHTLKSLSAVPADVPIRLAVLLRHIPDSGDLGQAAEEILKKLRYGRETVKTVSKLVSYRDREIAPDRKCIKRWLNEAGEDILRKHISIKRADEQEAGTDDINRAEIILDEILRKGECCSLEQLSVNGDDLIKAGISQGRAVGHILNSLLEMVINEETENDRAELIEKAMELYNGWYY
jgi:tRNA nucleotidyltransferase (CCA-adding enzyme)